MIKKNLASIPVCLLAVSCTQPVQVNTTQSYPIASDVYTTLQKTVVADATASDAVSIFPYEIAKYQQNGYGNWHFGEGLAAEKRIDLMPTTYTATSATNAARLMRFFTFTDIHLTDKESPAQAMYFGYKGGNSSAYSPTMLYSTQVLDAAVQTVNALHKQNPIDFGISLGDTINNAQYNELRWYVDVLDGKKINPDSGVKDDPNPGPLNDYQDEYQAAGLDKSIPWYQTLGNHDHTWMGAYPVNDHLRQAYLGETMLDQGDIWTDPRGIDSRGIYSGAIDGRTPYGDVIGAGLVGDFATPPKVLAADPNRRPLSRKEWMSEFFTTTSSPKGHGFTQANLDKDVASYTFEPKSNIPIKVIVLDDTQTDENYSLFRQGYLDNERLNWLVSELDKGQAEKKLMIIAAHVPINFIGWPANTNSPITASTLLAKLNTYPNLLLWLSGHVHRNVVTPHKAADAAHPELNFWEVETASLKDFPQQFRTFDIVRNSDNTVSIITTCVDPAVKDGSPAAMSRSYGIAAQQLFKYKVDPSTGAYNAELVKQLSPEMQAEIQKYGTAINK